jgi:tRNA pseudouridine13 synthase
MNNGNSLEGSVDPAAAEGEAISRRPVFDEISMPFISAELLGIGGILRQSPLDFEVEEISAYEPCGEGEHLFLWIEKRDTSAERLVSHLSRVLAIPKAEIGVAGLKDRHALTRQYVSVPARCGGRIAEVTTDAIRVLRSALHRNKLRTGHLRGNRFSILLREPCQEAGSKAEAVREKLALHGFPNYFGSQRFGVDRQTETLGFALLRGESAPRAIPYSRRKFLLRFALSAAQSALFNLALGERIANGKLTQVVPGDVMQVIGSGGLFVVSDVAAEQHRFDAGETVVTGPMFGPKMIQPEGEPQAWEASLLERHGLDPRDFTRFRKFTAGTRRPFLVRPEELSIETVSEGLRFRFDLPPGAYATVLLREFLKQPDFL